MSFVRPAAWGHINTFLPFRYFANLASVAQGDKEVTAPTMEQLKLLYERASGEKSLSISQIEALCAQAGVGPGVVARVIQGGKFDAAEPIDVDRYLFLLLAMSCDNFASVTNGIFDLFGRELEAARVTKFIAFLAPDMDPDVTTQFLAELNSALIDVQMVTYEVVSRIDVITAKMVV